MDRYMIWTMPDPPLLLRESSVTGEQIFGLGKWQNTKVICDYMYGHNDWVDDITEEEGRDRFPTAFITTKIIQNSKRDNKEI